ncbi:exported hypothetical protein [Candidatus Sulfopaludibacter sp. SbA3]|nr:exported hypothetical protein [Candidatus Sulfopaludibacter sp. SbA3]
MSSLRTLCIVAVFALTAAPLGAADLRGRVVDENEAPVPAARVTARTAASSTLAAAQSDPTGSFSLALPGPGDFLVSVEREGYYALKDRTIHVETALELTLVINSVREVFQSENVNAETSPLDVGRTQNQENLTGTEVNDVPYANSHSLRTSLQLMPGVVLDPAGLHVNGSSENQVLYVLNGFNITNPISGQFQTVLAVEGIRSVDVSSGRPAAEFGKGSAGVLAVSTENGTDSLHYTTTDFIPGVNLQQGLHLGNWYPRLGVSGPIVRGRAWFSDTFSSEYTESLVTGLPSGQNTRSGWAGSNLLHTQINLTPSNILFADFLVNVDNEDRVGLGPLNPVSTTSTVHTREYFGSIKDQKYFGRGVLLEFGYAHNDFSVTQTPQGQSLYAFSPQGKGQQWQLFFARDARGIAGPGHPAGLPAAVPACRLASTGGRRRRRPDPVQRRFPPHGLRGARRFRAVDLANAVSLVCCLSPARYRSLVVPDRHLASFQAPATRPGDSPGLGPANRQPRLVAARGIFLVSLGLGPHQDFGRLFRDARCRHHEHAGTAARPGGRHHDLSGRWHACGAAGGDNLRNRARAAETASRRQLERGPGSSDCHASLSDCQVSAPPRHR